MDNSPRKSEVMADATQTHFQSLECNNLGSGKELPENVPFIK